MLLVKTHVGLSSIHGTGLFTDENIPVGKRVWEWTFGIDTVINKGLIENLSDVQKKYLETYAWLDSFGNRWLCSDDTRFANHSDNPSCLSRVVDGRWEDIAIRDIKQGEEITYNYWEFHKGDKL